MKIEFVSQTVLRRAILKQLQSRRSEVVLEPSAAERCSAFLMETPGQAVMSTATVSGNAKEIGIYAVAKAVNDIAARGAEPVGVSVQIMLPPHAYESRLKSMVEHMEAMCAREKLQITCAEAEVSPALNQAIVTVTAMGQAGAAELLRPANVKGNQDIVQVGYIGLEGMLRVTAEKEEALRQRFVAAFIRQIQAAKSQLTALPAIRIGRQAGVTAMQQIGKGGILASLWEVAEEANVGLSVSLPAMTIKQETIEVCEYYHLNPYQLTSAGTILMFCDDGKEIVRKMEEAGICASLLGKTTEGKERVITGGAEVRYMDRPQPDELNKIWMK